MNGMRHQAGDRCVDQTVPGQQPQPFKLPTADASPVVTGSAGGTGVTGMQVTLVINLDPIAGKGGGNEDLDFMGGRPGHGMDG